MTDKKLQGELGYAVLSEWHKDVARRLVDPKANGGDWKNFFGEVCGIVFKRFGSMVKNDAGLEVDDFLNGYLMSYLAFDKCVVLRRFLNLNGPTYHFGSSFFVNHILAAVDRAVAENRTKFDPHPQPPPGGDDVPINVIEQISNGQALVGAESEDEGDPITVAIEECPVVFTAILVRFWKACPYECYAAMMDWYLKFDHRKIGAHFGVMWKPGFLHPDISHIVASEVEGMWIPEDGYVWDGRWSVRKK